MNIYQIILLSIVIIINFVAYALMGIDKKRAIQGKWRIKEKTLFFIATMFGGVGAMVGMFGFNHKTRHWYFKFGFPILALVTIIATIMLFNLLSAVG